MRKGIAILCLAAMLAWCLSGCGKPPAVAAEPDGDNPVKNILGTYSIDYSGEGTNGVYNVDIVEGDPVSYSVLRGPAASLENVDSFNEDTLTATVMLSVESEKGEATASVELTFSPSGDKEDVSCAGTADVLYADGSKASFTLNGIRLSKIGEKP